MSDWLVNLWDKTIFEPFEILFVRIPCSVYSGHITMPIYGDQLYTGLKQTTSQQAL